MLDICSDYARDHSFVFNANKTICTDVGKPKFTVCDVLIDNHLIQWSDHFTYLGAPFVSGSDLSVNVAPVRRKFYVACNSINARSHGLADPVRVQLVKSCCLPLITYCVGAMKRKRSDLQQMSVGMMHSGAFFILREVNLLKFCRLILGQNIYTTCTDGNFSLLLLISMHTVYR